MVKLASELIAMDHWVMRFLGVFLLMRLNRASEFLGAECPGDFSELNGRTPAALQRRANAVEKVSLLRHLRAGAELFAHFVLQVLLLRTCTSHCCTWLLQP